MPLPAGLLLGASLASQVGSGIAQNIGNKKAQKRAFGHNVDMWNRANAYNDPSAQMARLKGAGLNPNLVYGTGSVTGNTSTQTPKYQAETVEHNVDTGKAMENLGQYNNFAIQKAQVDNLKANSENVRARTITEFIKGSKYTSDAEKAQIEAGVAKQLEQTSVETGKQQLNFLKQKMTTERKNQMLKELEIALKAKELQWMKKGVTKNDSIWMRQALDWMEEMNIKRKGLGDKIKLWLNKY